MANITQLLADGVLEQGGAALVAPYTGGESLQSYDLGGIALGYSPTNRIGSRYVEVTVIGSNGRLMN